MKQSLHFLGAAVLAIGAAFTAGAQDPIEGYFRVQSALGTADNTGYVEVRGPMTTAPDVTYDNALTAAGTVMRLRAFPDNSTGVLRYKIGNLSSQGIEVFGAPQADYFDALMNIAGDIKTDDYLAAAYGIQRHAREIGYISTGRMIVQALFQVVAGRLDSEINSLPQDVKDKLYTGESLEDFAIRFNKEVSANIDLHAYLEPVANTNGQYRLYFNWIDCTEVSKFYLANEQNKKSFELGFECMRQYMNGKNGLGSGETIDDAEAALWKTWGFDIDARYADCYNAEGKFYQLSYEKIFADHELLYNWLKMYIERFLDPAKAPDASILGINFKDFAAEMQRHEIMKGFLKYIPSIQEGQKLYLTSGRFSDGTNEFSTVGTTSDGAARFGLLGEAQAIAAGNAAIWNLLPIDEDTNYFAIAPAAHRSNKPGEADAHLASAYFDFPFEPVNTEVMKAYNMKLEAIPVKSTYLEHLEEVHYVEISEPLTKVDRLTPVLIESTSDDVLKNMVHIIYESQPGDYNPDVTLTPAKPEGFIVSDEEVAVQHSNRRRAADTDEEKLPAEAHGVLFSTPASDTSLKHLWGINTNLDNQEQAAYTLSTREQKVEAESKELMDTPWFTEATTLPANQVFMLAEPSKPLSGISLGTPADELVDIPTGVEGVEAAPVHDNVIYDLYGRKVVNPTPGAVYILNGKKILIR